MKLAHTLAGTNAPLAWKTLPDMRSDGVKSAARAMVPLAAAIDAGDALFLTVVLSNPADRRRKLSLHEWGMKDGVLCSSPYDPGVPGRADSITRLVTHHLLDIFADLVRRWPRTAMPRQIGLITDGHGMCFHSAYPDGLDPRWLHDHLSGRDPACEILPLSPDGYLGVICAGATSTRH